MNANPELKGLGFRVRKGSPFSHCSQLRPSGLIFSRCLVPKTVRITMETCQSRDTAIANGYQVPKDKASGKVDPVFQLEVGLPRSWPSRTN
jgi:hypothetical protein